MGKKTKTVIKKGPATSPATTNRKPAREKKSIPLFWIVTPVIITAICFLPMLQNNFTNWDDEYYVLRNSLLPDPDWKGIFTEQVVSNYHPLTILSLALNYAISGTEEWSYLLLNLMLHLVNTALVFIFIYRISGEKIFPSFFTALLFGIHPLHVESVAWISERKDVLYTLFFILALIQYWRFIKDNKPAGLWICFLFFVLSLLSKPAAIILPLVLFLLDYWNKRPFSKKLIIEKIPFFLVAALFTVITLRLQSETAMASLDQYPLWMRLFLASYVTMIYSLRFFIPYPLSSFHPFPRPDEVGLDIYLSPLFVLALLFFIWRFRKNRIIVFGFLFFMINLLLVLQIVSIGFTIVSERYTYVPYIGLAFLAAMVVEKFFIAKKQLAWTAAILLFGIFAVLSFNRTKVWQNSYTLWSDVIDHYPRAPLPRADRAQWAYNKAITQSPAEALPYFQQVIKDCTVAITADSSSNPNGKGQPAMYLLRGVSYKSIDEPEKAFSDFNDYLSMVSDNALVFNSRGNLLLNHYEKYAEALKDFNKAIEIDPAGNYFYNRSICYYYLGDIEKAKADVETARQKGVEIPESYRQDLRLGQGDK